MPEGVKELIAHIRKEEREKILEEMKSKENNSTPWNHISNYIDDWGKESDIYNYHLHKIKNAIYTIIRYSLDIDRMSNLKEEQVSMAENIADNLLEMIYPSL